MKRTLLVVALLLVAAGTVMATGAVPFDGESDELDSANQTGVVLAPADSSNGDRYAEFDDAGELNITLEAIAGSTTQIDDVFVLGFEGRGMSTLPAEIQIDYESEALTILRMDTGEPVRSETITLEPNESVTLGFEVTADSDTPESFVETITYRATLPGSEIDIEFDSGSREIRIVTRIDPSDLDETSDPNLTVPPRAIINRTTGEGLAFTNEIGSNGTEFEGVNADAVIQTGETISLSGSRSLVDTSYAIDVNRRLVSLFDIPVSEAEANESATISVPLDAEQFNGTDPSEATLARLTNDDWQSLPTRVNESADEGVPGRVVLQARTPGFSVFGVFARAETTYTWESDGETTEGRTANFSFEDPGMHPINLTVTDAFGRSNTTTYRVLANDPPSVDIEPGEFPANETVRLQADVTNVIGEETITWRFEDGITATGQEINRSFERGEVVNVTVEDGYGATGTDEVVAGLQGANPILNVFQWQLGFEGRIAVVVVLSILIIGGIRWVVAERYYRNEERTDDRDLI